MPSFKLTALDWKVRRVASGLRQQDVARETGLSITYYSELERGLRTPKPLERRVIEALLPSLAASFEEIGKRVSPSDLASDGLGENST